MLSFAVLTPMPAALLPIWRKSRVLRSIDLLGRAQDLNGTDIAVVKGEIGVAENAAVWIPQTVKYKALYFIAEKLVIVLDKNRIVSNMHQSLRTDKR